MTWEELEEGLADWERQLKEINDFFDFVNKKARRDSVGKWEDKKEGAIGWTFVVEDETTSPIELPTVWCSVCGRPVVRVGSLNYCPNCGAEMRGEKNATNKEER